MQTEFVVDLGGKWKISNKDQSEFLIPTWSFFVLHFMEILLLFDNQIIFHQREMRA